jgi:hypothetical protein
MIYAWMILILLATQIYMYIKKVSRLL